nr:hypothetical protein [Trichoderma atroviride]
MANGAENKTHTESQVYLSTRGGDYDLSFETVVLKGLAADGGLFLPHQIPTADKWREWKDLSYPELAFEILSLYISRSEIPADDLKAIIDRSYSTFRSKDVAPLVHLENNLYLLELFHGPSYSFKDCALQFLGNLFEYFLVRKNQGKEGKDRHHLTVVGATSGDTGSAAIYGLKGKKDVSVFILHPKGRISPIQELQMTTCTDANVHNLAIEGTFDDCQDIVKAMFGDADANEALQLGAVNSINFSRILAQIVYYFHAYFSLARQSSSFKVGDEVRFVTPTGNFGNILAGYFAKQMGLPVAKLVGMYSLPNPSSLRSKSDSCIINFAATVGMDEEFNRKQAGQEVSAWYKSLKTTGGFGPVHDEIMDNGRRTFESERVSDAQTVETIKSSYNKINYVLDPHSAVGVTASERSIARTDSNAHHISLSTAHPAKFSDVVTKALADEPKFNFEEQVLPDEFKALSTKEKRVTLVENSWEKVRELVKSQVEKDLKAEGN